MVAKIVGHNTMVHHSKSFIHFVAPVDCSEEERLFGAAGSSFAGSAFSTSCFTISVAGGAGGTSAGTGGEEDAGGGVGLGLGGRGGGPGEGGDSS